MTLWEIAGTISLLQWIYISGAWLLGIIVATAAVLKFVFKRERYLHRNLQRPIVVLDPLDGDGKQLGNTDLDDIRKMIGDNEFLTLDERTKNAKTFLPRDNHYLVVIGYDPEMVGLADIVNRVKTLDIPLIVYTYGNNSIREEENKKLLSSYPWTNYANYKISLLNTIFSTLGSWPYFKSNNQKSI